MILCFVSSVDEVHQNRPFFLLNLVSGIINLTFSEYYVRRKWLAEVKQGAVVLALEEINRSLD
jgi:hypothetical protein